jgi:hypothetical protein
MWSPLPSVFRAYSCKHINVQLYLTAGHSALYVRHLESKERFAIKKYLLKIGKKKKMQVLSYTFTYFST